MKRQLALLDYALGSLRRRGLRTVTMIIGIAFVVGLYASVLMLAESLRHEWRSTLDMTPDLVVQRMVGGRPALLDPNETFGVSNAPGVSNIRPRVWGYVFFEAISANVTVVALDAESDAYLEGMQGRRPIPHAQVSEAVVGAALADRLGIRPGDRMAIPDALGETRVLEVSGVFRSSSALHSADVLLVEEPVARALLAMPPGQVTDIAIDLSREEEASVVAAQVRESMPTARVIERSALVRTYELTFDGRAGLLAVTLLPCLAALLLLCWDRLTGLGGNERREIGVLKAIGWETRDVLTARVWESATVAMAGAWLGALLAYGYVYLLGAPGFASALFGWSSLYPELELTPMIESDQAWTLIGVVVLPFVGVSIVPAWRAATVDPDEAMR